MQTLVYIYIYNIWREGLIVSLFKKGDKEDPGNYRGITLLIVVGKVFCKILNDRLVQYLDKSSKIHEGQAGFRAGRCCIDNIFTKKVRKHFHFFSIFKKHMIQFGIMACGLSYGIWG